MKREGGGRERGRKGGGKISKPLLSISFVVCKRLPPQAGWHSEVCVGLADISFSVQTGLWKEEGEEEGDVWMRSFRMRERKEGAAKSIRGDKQKVASEEG